MYWFALVAAVTYELASFSEAKISKQVKESGTIRSESLSQGETYEYLFDGFPNKDHLLLFNITRIKGLENEDFKIYNDPVTSDATSCSVFERRVTSDRNPCHDLWRSRYGGCVLNKVAADRCTATFKRRGTEQQLTVEYKIIDCITLTEKIVTNEKDRTNEDQTTKPTGAKQKLELTTQNAENERNLNASTGSLPTQDANTFGLAFILPITFIALIIIVIIAIVAYQCNKRERSRTPKETPQVVEEAVYEEIPDRLYGDTSWKEDPYNSFERGGAKEEMRLEEIPYNTFNRNEGKQQEISVVGLLVPGTDDQKLN